MKYNNRIINSEKSVKVNDLEVIEKKHQFKFPNEFIEFYLENNGGELEKYTFSKRGKIYAFNNFYPIRYTDYCLEKMLDLCSSDNMPKYLIPFGTDPGGDQFCFSIKRGEEGKIYYLAHEFYEGGNSRKGIHVLANSLTEFINQMIEEK